MSTPFRKFFLLSLTLLALRAHAEGDSKIAARLNSLIEQNKIEAFTKELQKASTEDLLIALKKSLVTPDARFLKRLLRDKKVLSLIDSHQDIAALPIQENFKTHLVLLANSKPQIIKGARLDDGRTLLHEAVATADLEIIQWIVKKEVSLLDALDSNGETILFPAARRGKTDIASYLVHLPKINRKLKNKKNQTAADAAIEADFPKTAAILK